MSDILECTRRGRVLHLRLNRPEKRNALNVELCRQLVRSMEDANDDREVGAIVLTAGGPAFCAGMDLGEIAAGDSNAVDSVHEELFTIGARLSIPVVAAVSGAALGGGTGLVANCHVVVASAQATFGLTEIRLGLWPFLVFRAIAAALGERRAVELSLCGRIFPASEAREIGLVHEVNDSAEERAMEIAEALAAFSPTAIRSGLDYTRETRGRSWREAGEVARRMRGELFRGADFQEGIAAFREKRAPRWPSLE